VFHVLAGGVRSSVLGKVIVHHRRRRSIHRHRHLNRHSLHGADANRPMDRDPAPFEVPVCRSFAVLSIVGFGIAKLRPSTSAFDSSQTFTLAYAVSINLLSFYG
jgi:hypothetical protein